MTYSKISKEWTLLGTTPRPEQEKIINETAKEENIKSTKENKIKKIFLQIKSKIKQTKMKRRKRVWKE